MSDTGFPREVREIVIVDEDHQKAIRNLFMVCKGRLESFHLHGKQWRFDSDSLETSPIPPPGGWGTTFVTLHEVLREEKQAFVVDEQAILRGQWSGDRIYTPAVTQSPPPGVPPHSTSIELTGVEGTTRFGNIQVEVLPTLEFRFDTLMARVAALEVALNAIRESPPGMGHNRGPTDFEPASPAEMAEIDHLIVLLRQQTPTTVSNRQELVEAEKKTSQIAEKIKEYADEFFKDAAKSFGHELGKQLARVPLWLGLYAALGLTSSALLAWLQNLPA